MRRFIFDVCGKATCFRVVAYYDDLAVRHYGRVLAHPYLTIIRVNAVQYLARQDVCAGNVYEVRILPQSVDQFAKQPSIEVWLVSRDCKHTYLRYLSFRCVCLTRCTLSVLARDCLCAHAGTGTPYSRLSVRVGCGF